MCGHKPKMFYLKIRLVPRSKHSHLGYKRNHLFLQKAKVAVFSKILNRHIKRCGQRTEFFIHYCLWLLPLSKINHINKTFRIIPVSVHKWRDNGKSLKIYSCQNLRKPLSNICMIRSVKCLNIIFWMPYFLAETTKF